MVFKYLLVIGSVAVATKDTNISLSPLEPLPPPAKKSNVWWDKDPDIDWDEFFQTPLFTGTVDTRRLSPLESLPPPKINVWYKTQDGDPDLCHTPTKRTKSGNKSSPNPRASLQSDVSRRRSVDPNACAWSFPSFGSGSNVSNTTIYPPRLAGMF